MSLWTFTSLNNWFTTKFPKNWSEYEDDEGTYAFFNAEKWSGNFRITPFRWSTGSNKASSYIKGELKDNLNAIAIKIGDWDAAFYSKEADGNNLIYFWVTGFENTIFLCSLVVDKESIGTDEHNSELSVVEEVINNLKII